MEESIIVETAVAVITKENSECYYKTLLFIEIKTLSCREIIKIML